MNFYDFYYNPILVALLLLLSFVDALVLKKIFKRSNLNMKSYGKFFLISIFYKILTIFLFNYLEKSTLYFNSHFIVILLTSAFLSFILFSFIFWLIYNIGFLKIFKPFFFYFVFLFAIFSLPYLNELIIYTGNSEKYDDYCYGLGFDLCDSSLICHQMGCGPGSGCLAIQSCSASMQINIRR